MITMKKGISILAVICFLAITTGLFAQDKVDNISPQRKQAIDSLALEKVRDLSKYISIIGDKKTQWSEAQRVIEQRQPQDGGHVGPVEAGDGAGHGANVGEQRQPNDDGQPQHEPEGDFRPDTFHSVCLTIA